MKNKAFSLTITVLAMAVANPAWSKDWWEKYSKQADHTAISALGNLTIVPGERVGPFKLWMALDDIEKTLGKPDIVNQHRLDNGGDYYMFNKYIWFKYGLMMTSPQSDAHQKIDSIEIFSSEYITNGGVGYHSPFNEALNNIRESQDSRYKSFCDNGGCAAYDSAGLWIRADSRTGPLTDVIVYDAAWDWSHQHKLWFGNFAPPADQETQ